MLLFPHSLHGRAAPPATPGEDSAEGWGPFSYGGEPETDTTLIATKDNVSETSGDTTGSNDVAMEVGTGAEGRGGEAGAK